MDDLHPVRDQIPPSQVILDAAMTPLDPVRPGPTGTPAPPTSPPGRRARPTVAHHRTGWERRGTMVRMTAAFPVGRHNRTMKEPEPCPVDWPSAETREFMVEYYGRALSWDEYRARRDRFVTVLYTSANAARVRTAL